LVPWKPLARFLTITSSSARGAMRLSISTASVPACSTSTGIFLTHRPMSELGPLVVYAVVV
jgi:hypothetical protein